MTLEQHILTKLKENKGVLVDYKDLHPYWLNYKKIEEKQGLINQIFTKISKIRKDNPNMKIKTIRMQGYVYECEIDIVVYPKITGQILKLINKK